MSEPGVQRCRILVHPDVQFAPTSSVVPQRPCAALRCDMPHLPDAGLLYGSAPAKAGDCAVSSNSAKIRSFLRCFCTPEIT